MKVSFAKSRVTKVYLNIFFLIFIINNSYAQTAKEAKGKSSWEYNTLAHQLLQKEVELSKFSQKQKAQYLEPGFKLLDRLITEASNRLTSLPESASERETALKSLEVIDQVFQDMNFVICANANNFIQALHPKKFREFPCTKFRYNHQYEKYIQDSSTYFHGMDNDLGSIMYYSIGQVTNLPLFIIELPDYHMVRWQLKSGEHINWDISSAKAFSDEEVMNGNGDLYQVKVSKEEVEIGHYMQNMTDAEMTSYYNLILAESLRVDGRYIGAIEHFEKAIEERPYSAQALHDFAAMLVTTPVLKSRGLNNRAYGMTREVDRILPSYKPYKSTYACTCAAIGSFEKAIKLEKKGLNNPEKLDAFRKGLTCVDIIEYQNE